MDDRKMEIIEQLMQELQEEMHPTSDDLGMRLGRPKVEVMKMEGDMDDAGLDMDMGDEMDSPDEMLKRRLMKLRE